MKKGVFITFEGVDGAGKSTQIELLKNYLDSKNIPNILSKEPGGTPRGQKIREILLENSDEPFPAIAELLLYQADRNLHVKNKIKPALEEGKVVLCDRFYDSTLAYQGYARGLDKNLIKNLNELATEGLAPNLTCIFDIPIEESLKRVGKDTDRIEKEGLQFKKDLQNGFLEIAKTSERFVVLDGMKTIDEVFLNLKKVIADRFGF